LLTGLGCRIEGLLVTREIFTPTYLKPRNCRVTALSGEYERYDTKNRQPTPLHARKELMAHVEDLLPHVDAMFILEQVEEAECGVVTTEMRDLLARLGTLQPAKLLWADSRHRIARFRNVVIKANVHEAIKETIPGYSGSPDDAVVRRAVSELARRTGKLVFVTAGARGIWVGGPEPALVRGVEVQEPTDPTGAGDSATAGAVLALCAGANPLEAALIANLVASITVQQLATTGTATPDQLGPRLEMWRSQAEC